MDYRLFGLFVLFWAILTQTINLERLTIGLIICTAVYLFNKEFQSKNKNINKYFISNLKFFFSYISRLIIEIFKSNFHVAKIVLNPKLNISTSIVTIETKLKNEFNKTILANSITLTPGTLTLDLSEDKLMIHCLDINSADNLEKLCFERILLKKEELNND